MEVVLQILACLILPTLPKGCNNHLQMRAAAPCEMTQQGMCPGSSLLGHVPMVGPQQRPQFPIASPWTPSQVLPSSSHMATTMMGGMEREGAMAPIAKMKKELIPGALHPDNNLLSVLLLPSTCHHLWQQGTRSAALLLRHQMGHH